MADWRDQFKGPSRSRRLVHPDAPAGGSGPGSSRPPGPVGTSSSSRFVPDLDSPAGQHFDWTHQLPFVDTAERASAVYGAIKGAGAYVPQALREATGQELHEIVAGLVPGLLLLIGVLALSTAVGAAAGAAVGALAGGVGAIPGAAIGAEIGFDLGVVLLEWFGLAFLAIYVGKSLMKAVSVAAQAVRTAWDSVDDERFQGVLIDRASRRLALAVALVFRGILQGIVAFLLAKGTAAAAERVPELVAKLRASRLGAVFADWVERNWQKLIADPRLKDRAVPGNKGTGGAVPGSQPTTSNQPLKVARRIPEKAANTAPARPSPRLKTDSQCDPAYRHRTGDRRAPSRSTRPEASRKSAHWRRIR
jgi:hypothetical protein